MKSVLIRSFFWFVFSRIRTEYGDLRPKSPYSDQIRENKDQKETPYLDTFQAVNIEYKLFLILALILYEVIVRVVHGTGA